jgi:hypothetical protein
MAARAPKSDRGGRATAAAHFRASGFAPETKQNVFALELGAGGLARTSIFGLWSHKFLRAHLLVASYTFAHMCQ